MMMIAGSAEATLVGDEVRITESAFGTDFTATVVEPGSEGGFFHVAAVLVVDVHADSVSLIYNLASGVTIPEAIWEISDLDWVGSPGTVTGLSLTDGDASFVVGLSFTADSVSFTIGEYDEAVDGNVQVWTFAIETTHADI